MLNLFQMDFMYPTFSSPRVIVVSEKEYEKRKNAAQLKELCRSEVVAKNRLKSLDEYKKHLTEEMTRCVKVEDSIKEFQKELKEEKEKLKE